MRKDVKIGLAIGGVLLAVLIVYALVPKNNDSEYARDGDVSNVDDGGVGNGAGAGGGDAGNGEAAGTGVSTAGASESVGSQQGGAQNGGASGNGQDAARDAGARQQASAGGDTGAPQGGDGAAAESDRKFDWEQILATGIVPEEARVGLVAPGGIENDPFDNRQNGGGAPGNDDVVWPSGSQGAKAGATGGAPGGAVQQPQQPQQPAQPRTGIKTHTVQPGETYSKISLVVYGDARYYNELKKANPNVDEKRLRPGTVINIPDASAFKTRGAQQASAALAAAPTIDAKSEYQVQQGDSLYKIAVKLYGKSDKADAIYELNKDKIGDDPAKVKVGMVLKLPQPLASATPSR